jgi:hypothetical protein
LSIVVPSIDDEKPQACGFNDEASAKSQHARSRIDCGLDLSGQHNDEIISGQIPKEGLNLGLGGKMRMSEISVILAQLTQWFDLRDLR